MASSFNRVILLGNLTRDPEVQFSKSGTAVCKFGLAVNRKYKAPNGEWVEEPTFVDCTMFGSRGEAFAKYHGKGKPAFIEGELRFDQWEDKQTGQKRSKLYVVANSFEFVGGGGGDQPRGQGQRREPAPAYGSGDAYTDEVADAFGADPF